MEKSKSLKQPKQKKVVKESTRIIARELIVIGACVAIGLVTVIICATQTSTIVKKITAAKQDSINAEQRNASLVAAQNSLNQTTISTEDLASAFVQADNTADFIFTVKKLASLDGVTVDITFSAPTPNQGTAASFALSRADFTLIGTGTTAQFAKFLEDFETLPYIAAINTATFTGDTAGGVSGGSKITASGNVYIREDASTQTTTPSKPVKK